MLLIPSLWLRQLLLLLLLVLLLSISFNSAQNNVKTLPGYRGYLPFKLETGYVGVGESEEVQLFYYFIESEGDPARDPLVLWLTGGPGCSAFSGLVYEIGPLAFDFEAFDGNFPSFIINPYAWTKIASIIFLDLPVGTGFSYSTTSDGYKSSDAKAATDAYVFLQKWLLSHPKLMRNPLYIAGDSYAGKLVPIVVLEISEGNEAGLIPHMFIKGYVVGNPTLNQEKDRNWRVPYDHRMGLISDEYYKLAKSSCHEEYVNPDPENAECLLALQLIKQCISNICDAQILEPKCNFTTLKSDRLEWDGTNLEDDSAAILLPSKQERLWCRAENYLSSSVWANDPTAREALQVRNGTKGEWLRCNRSLSFDKDVPSAFHYHQVLSTKGLRALIYSGDHDRMVPYIGTLKWIKDLNLTLDDDWRPWFVNGQTAGYTMKYVVKEAQFHLTFATVKGAGHTAPEYKPKECLAMIERWFSRFPL